MAKYLDTLKDMVNAPKEIAQAPAEQWLKDRISMKEGLGDMSEANLTNAEAAQMLLDYEAFKEKNREEWRANPASERQLKALEDRGIEIQKQLTMGKPATCSGCMTIFLRKKRLRTRKSIWKKTRSSTMRIS